MAAVLGAEARNRQQRQASAATAGMFDQALMLIQERDDANERAENFKVLADILATALRVARGAVDAIDGMPAGHRTNALMVIDSALFESEEFLTQGGAA